MEFPKQDGTPTAAEPIAICGMALRLPGGISTPSGFWDFLIDKKDAQGSVPATRYSAAKYYSKAGKPGFVNSDRGYFLDESVDLGGIDTTLFTMPKNEVERADPQQRLLLELTRECFESAGEVNYRGKTIGTFVGSFGEDWAALFAKDAQIPALYKVSGYGDFVLSNRISYEYDLRGPSMTIRTGCSAGLTGLHQACLAIRGGDCDSAIVGGCSLLMAPGLTADLSEQQVLSPTGSSKTFDAAADGYARGEAVNMIYVKRLKEAIRDGNPIRAVIRGTFCNADGKKSGLTLPSYEGHEALIRKAYEVAGISDVSATGFVECHGTGTPVGDPIEARAIATVFGERGVYIGSVKPNVGHSEGASGLTSLIKSVLALEHRVIPPNIKFDQPNPKIPFKQKNLVVPVEPTPWPRDRLERASVNSFGIGGANAHVVVDSASAYMASKPPPFTGALEAQEHALVGPQLMVFSANTPDSLLRQVKNNQKYIDENQNRLPAIAYTLASRRDHLPHRTFSVLGNGTQHYASSPAKIPSTGGPLLIFVFTGQGAQWPRMGSELLTSESCPVFKKSIQAMDIALSAVPNGPVWSIADELLKPEDMSKVGQADYSQPLCTAVQIALVDTLYDFGVRPCAVVGHSSGELAASYAAGKISREDAISAAYYRGVVSAQVSRPGAMAALGMSLDDATALLVDGVVVACENSPSNVTISGDRAQVTRVLDSVKERDPSAFSRQLRVDIAYHSQHMREVGDEYESLLVARTARYGREPATVRPEQLPRPMMFSTVTGQQLIDTQNLDAKYWRSNLESPVLFKGAITSLVEHCRVKTQAGVGTDSVPPLVFLELGPHSALAGPLRQTLVQQNINAPYSSCLVRNKNAVETLLTALGQLWQQNTSIDFERLTNPDKTLRVVHDLPPYPWQHDHSYLFGSRLFKQWKFPRARKHELLGARVAESTDNEPIWRNVLHLAAVPWLRDHKVHGEIVFPCAGYIAMAGEAVRQLVSITSENTNDLPFFGFRVHGIAIDTALLLQEKKPTEILTSLTRYRLTDTLESDRWDFVISSHNGAGWTKHCTGQVSALARPGAVTEGATTDNTVPVTKFPRLVDSPRWYQTMYKIGGQYGPTFQGLTDIACTTKGNRASATARHTAHDEEEFYAIHPTKIDFFLQLLAVASIQGVRHNLTTMAVPTYIESIDVYASESELNLYADAVPGARGAIAGGGMGLTREDISGHANTALAVRGVKMSPVQGDIDEHNQDPHAGARIHWQEDADFFDILSAVTPNNDQLAYTDDLRELTALYIRDSLETLAAEQLLTPPAAHLQKYLKWMQSQPSPKMQTTVGSLLGKLQNTELNCMVAAVKHVYNNIVPIFQGSIEPIEVLMQNSILEGVYKALDWSKRPDVFRVLAHANPHMRILEIGAGTGGTTDIVLSSIGNAGADQCQRMYSNYTYTDISAGFFGAAQKRFERHTNNMDFRVLDISQDPREQGFEENAYDLVLASNVIHATPSLVDTLRNIRSLLKPEGRLYLEELTTETKAWNYVMGILPGWWLGEADGRVDEPYAAPQHWDSALKEAGFGGIDDFALDCPNGKHSNAFYLATPLVQWTRPREITMLFDAASFSQAALLKRCLESKQYTICLHDFDNGGMPPLDRDMVSVLDMPQPYFDDIQPSRLRAFQDLMAAASAGSAGVFWLTRPCQLGQCADPRWGQVQGAARVIRSELALDLATCEVEKLEDDNNSCLIIERVLAKFLRRRSERPLGIDYEYAITQQGRVCIPRVYPVNVNSELRARADAAALAHAAASPSRLGIEKIGRMNTLRWFLHEPETLGDDDLLIEPKAVGMNFFDIAVVTGIIDTNVLGLDAAGVVRAVGNSNVGGIRTGARVMVMGVHGFSTSVKASRQQCVEIPDTLSFIGAATMSAVFATVIYSLLDIGRMRKGQTLLIHSACGGVGLAAIQVARMVGAGELYCTVSSEVKVRHLMTAFGIPRDRIFNSRDSSFRDDLMRATKGKGVDIVLNSLSGEQLHTSWDCVAEFGTMIELGKRDLLGHGRLALNQFQGNRSYQCVDLFHLFERRPAEGHRLLRLIMQYYEEGHIQPIDPIEVFTVDKVQECFLYMQKGQHIGKIVVDLEHESSGSPHTAGRAVSAGPYSYGFNPTSSYLLVGGLGGLGRAVSSWMVSNGARHFVYLGRTAGKSTADQAFLEELRSQDCSVSAVAGDVTALSDVQRAVAAAGEWPLKGVINMSMVLRDGNFSSLTHDAWTAATAPKVSGTWNLHQATKGHELDIFLLFSSASATFGQHGQANYAAANSFLDAFVRYRLGCGMPAQSINIGLMLDHGYLADNDAMRERLISRGNYGIHVTELFDALSAVLASPSLATDKDPMQGANSGPPVSQLIIGARSSMSLHDPNNRVMFKGDRRMAIYLNEAAGSEGSADVRSARTQSSKISALIATAINDDPSVLASPDVSAFLARQIGAQLLALLLRPIADDDGLAGIDVSQSLQDMGLDSLVAIELRGWWKTAFQFDISVLEMLATPTLLALGQRAVEGLRHRVAAERMAALGQTHEATTSDDANEHGVNVVDPRLVMKMP